MHANTHTRIHTNTQTRTHTNTHARAHTHTHTHTHHRYRLLLQRILKIDILYVDFLCLQSINNSHKDWICGLAFMPGGNCLLSGCRGGLLKLWNIDTCNMLGEIRAHDSPINSITTNSSLIFTASKWVAEVLSCGEAEVFFCLLAEVLSCRIAEVLFSRNPYCSLTVATLCGILSAGMWVAEGLFLMDFNTQFSIKVLAWI